MPSLRLPLVLASASPRRADLLHDAGYEFEIVSANIDEEASVVPDPVETALQIALRKATAIAQLRGDSIVLGADTVVAFESGNRWEQLAKPADSTEACSMLRKLSNRTHIVVTGVAILWPGGSTSFNETSQVTFRELSESEIHAYVATGEPMDKAGAYAIQGGAAGFVSKLEGSLENVIGLPITEVARRLAII